MADCNQGSQAVGATTSILSASETLMLVPAVLDPVQFFTFKESVVFISLERRKMFTA